jgi:glycosyltransferase involved in cell wall biosynthesis
MSENILLEKISVIVSCFNEEKTIRECVERIQRTLPNSEILVICGGTDNTIEIAKELALKDKNMKVLKNYGDTGKGHAVKLGISIAQYDIMVQIDADLQFMPEEIPKVVRPILDNEFQISFGVRFAEDSNVENYNFSFFRVMGNKLVNKYISFLTGQRFCDITTGLKAWTRKAIEDINFRDNRFVYEMEIAVRGTAKGYNIAMVPITYFNRLGGISGHGRAWREPISIILTGAKILLDSTLIAWNMK